MPLQTTTFDDGSTLTWSDDYSYVASTDATDFVNVPSANWSPASANPAAGSWEDVLKFGLARTIDAKTRPVRPENVQPLYQQPQIFASSAGDLFGIPPMVWLLLAGVAFFALRD